MSKEPVHVVVDVFVRCSFILLRRRSLATSWSARKGTNRFSTNGVAANFVFIFLQRDFSGTPANRGIIYRISFFRVLPPTGNLSIRGSQVPHPSTYNYVSNLWLLLASSGFFWLLLGYPGLSWVILDIATICTH